MKPIDTFYIIIGALGFLLVLFIGTIINVISGDLASLLFIVDVLFLLIITVMIKENGTI